MRKNTDLIVPNADPVNSKLIILLNMPLMFSGEMPGGGENSLISQLNNSVNSVFENNYIELKGTEKHSMTIDRIKVNIGYTINNLQTLTKSENSIKRNNVDYPF